MELPLIFVSIFYSVETMRSTEEGIKKIKKRDKKKTSVTTVYYGGPIFIVMEQIRHGREV